MEEDLLDVVVYEDADKQIRFVISEFRDKEYISLRKYYMGFEGDWLPTKEGVTLPYTLDTTTALFKGFVSIMSQAEVLHEIVENAK